MTRALVSTSGGTDSIVALAWAVDTYGADNVAAIYFDYGQPPARAEETAAAIQAEREGVPLYTVDLSTAGRLVDEGDVEDTRERHGYAITGYIANRDIMCLAVAANVADVRGYDDVVFGLNGTDPITDAKKVLLAAMFAYFGGVRLVTPFAVEKKYAAVALGEEYGVDWSSAVSCYNIAAFDDPACGACQSCVERAEAFAGAGVDDPRA
jgi:7-cyano-7-deazaguanine synthase